MIATNDVLSWHWQKMTIPEDPGSGHGANNPRNIFSTVPPGWGSLPPGTSPITTIGT